MSLALIAALPFLGALLPGLMIRAGRNSCATITFSVTGLALIGLLMNAPAVLRGEVLTEGYTWLPALGLNVNFMLDGLGFLFALLILGIGLLIIAYARFYLSKSDPMGNFYTYLLLFQGAMVGIVLSDNILLLLIFWELTSLSSFLLIGFWRHLPEGRQGARMALTVTGLGGLAMIGGMLILGQIAGSYDIHVILTQGEAIRQSDLYLPALLLILLGAFTKSAQFPFHFWLPHAMAAPTPVSAYLHSATMVKAGLFLMARLWPVLSGTPEWTMLVAGAGLITMVLGAVIALFKDDLKALLAFSTVSHLGLITFLLGLGTDYAAIGAVFHIINHATFKAALFMTAGIVDHEAGTRNIRLLGGLRKLMPITFAIGTVAALSMAGIPLFNGFLSKEMMLEAAHDSGTWVAVAATLGDGVRVADPGRLTRRILQSRIDDVVVVREAELRETLVRLLLEVHVLAEGAGALALAAGRRVPGKRKCAVVSGGNIDAAVIAQLLSEVRPRAPRRPRRRTALPPTPPAFRTDAAVAISRIAGGADGAARQESYPRSSSPKSSRDSALATPRATRTESPVEA